MTDSLTQHDHHVLVYRVVMAQRFRFSARTVDEAEDGLLLVRSAFCDLRAAK